MNLISPFANVCSGAFLSLQLPIAAIPQHGIASAREIDVDLIRPIGIFQFQDRLNDAGIGRRGYRSCRRFSLIHVPSCSSN